MPDTPCIDTARELASEIERLQAENAGLRDLFTFLRDQQESTLAALLFVSSETVDPKQARTDVKARIAASIRALQATTRALPKETADG